MITLASLVVEFGEGVNEETANVKVEFDQLRIADLYGEEKTQFAPGEEVWFLVHHDSDLAIEWVKPTSGTVNQGSDVARERLQQLLFTPKILAIDLEYIPSGQPVTEFYGNTAALGSVDGRRLPLVDYDTLRVADYVPSWLPAVCDAAYDVRFLSYRFVPGPIELEDEEDIYPVVIVVKVVNA